MNKYLQLKTTVPQNSAPVGDVPFPRVSVVIPARNEEPHIKQIVQAVFDQGGKGRELEVVVVDDGSTDGTAHEARKSGARVLELKKENGQGNPGAARNLGALHSSGDPIIFLDADCIVTKGWLDALLQGHAQGATVVGGAIDMPPGLPMLARCDYYCGWYLVHPKRTSAQVPHHPPPNLSVRRGPFQKTSGFSDQPPLDYTNEERIWQSELLKSGHQIYFESQAIALHYNRPGLGNLMRRNYRWGYTALESKSQTGAARLAWLYRYPVFLIIMSPLLALAHTAFIISCWVRAGRYEPVSMLPLVLLSRLAYVAGMAVGGVRWLYHRYANTSDHRVEPRWN